MWNSLLYREYDNVSAGTMSTRDRRTQANGL